MPLSTHYQTATSSAAALLERPFKPTLAQVEQGNGNGSLVVMLQDGPGEAVTTWPLPYLVIDVGAQVWVAW